MQLEGRSCLQTHSSTAADGRRRHKRLHLHLREPMPSPPHHNPSIIALNGFSPLFPPSIHSFDGILSPVLVTDVLN